VDADRFDTLTRSLREDSSRRSALGLTLGGALGLLQLHTDSARKRKKKKRPQPCVCPSPLAIDRCPQRVVCVCFKDGSELSCQFIGASSECKPLCDAQGGNGSSGFSAVPGKANYCTADGKFAQLLCPVV
jgi:hypothetical protein